MNRQEGFAPFVVLGIILLLGFIGAALTHHGSSHGGTGHGDDGTVVELGCRGSECSATAVPEPASLLMLGAGGLLVGFAVRRKL